MLGRRRGHVLRAAGQPACGVPHAPHARVQTEPYAHDRAASEPPVPLLEPITQLLATVPGSDADYELQTLLVRRRNRIQQELAEAGEALREGLAVLRSADT